MDGYKLLRNDRLYSRGGGICLYYKNYLKCKVLLASDLSSVGTDNNDCTEYLIVEVRYRDEKFLLGVFYSPPRSDCSEKLHQILSEMFLQYTNVVLVGDFNTDLTKRNAKTSRFYSVLDNFGINCVNQYPTHFYSDGCSLIDLLLTNNSDFVLNFNQVSSPGFSKHDIIFSSINISRHAKLNANIRDYNRINLPNLQST